ncbi:tetratricopeptide repeat protein [Rhizosphaericola mali]|uniref:Uncharacterized protein n=1 Tax=Rhizosphaericola mali TaxID=2545455 RepID=A0A5P2G8G7_9BACT|nr:hypothetical protein [Rhizosphaericola mali]QES90040.1 hypothetical protein E0W69_015705 [Rhizosphaericola mali]
MDRIEKIKELLKDNPIDSFLRHALALEYIKLEDFTLAQQTFIELLNDDPNYVGSYYHIAKLLESQNEKEKAIFYYEKGMEIAKKLNDRHAYNELQSAYEEYLY